MPAQRFGVVPRFTMIGGDFETVRGAWGVRGEVAAFVDDELQSTRAARGVPAVRSTAGIGVDRRAGDYRMAANVLWSWRGVDRLDPVRPGVRRTTTKLERTDCHLVVAADRSFARETRTLRVFAVYDPADATTFARVIGAVSVRDNVWLEGSAGCSPASSLDVIGRLTRRDFALRPLEGVLLNLIPAPRATTPGRSPATATGRGSFPAASRR